MKQKGLLHSFNYYYNEKSHLPFVVIMGNGQSQFNDLISKCYVVKVKEKCLIN